MTRVAAVVLAGGRGERLGGINKALVKIGNRTLIERARDVVAGCDPVLLSNGRSGFTTPGMTAIADLATDYAGPLAGLAAAIEALRDADVEFLLSLAVDTPFFPLDFLARAMPLLATADAVLGCFGAQDYPTNAVWRLHAIRALPAGVRDGTAPHSLKRLAGSLKTLRLDYAGIVAEDPFLNVNTPADLTILTARANARTSR